MSTCPCCGYNLSAKAKPRSLEQHKRYFALINPAYAQWPEMHDFKPDNVFVYPPKLPLEFRRVAVLPIAAAHGGGDRIDLHAHGKALGAEDKNLRDAG